MRTVVPERLERDLARLGDRDLGAADYRREVLDRIDAAVPTTAACLAAADPASLALTAHTSRGVARRGADRLYAAEYGVADVASHRSLAAGVAAQVLSRATAGVPERSHRFRTLLRPMGWQHELRAATRDRTGTWGFLHLYRSDDRPDFSATELELVQRIGPVVAAGMRAAVLRGVATSVPATAAPAVWVLDEDYRIAQSTPGSRPLLDALRDDQTPDDETPEVLVGLAVLARAEAARAARSEREPRVPRLMVPTTGGDWRSLHAMVLVGAAGTRRQQVVITSTGADAGDLLDLSLLSYRLTPAERAAVTLVLAGRSTKQIAEELYLTPYTVQDRMQDVFAKVGVRSRRELVATLAR